MIEAKSASQSPKSSTTSQNALISDNICPSTPSSEHLISTPYMKSSKKSQILETLHEKSNDNPINETFLDNTIDSRIDSLNATNSSKRKRKFVSPDQSNIVIKRKRDISYSDVTKKKISHLFRTPINYFSNRRRTIGEPVNQSINDSILSSSGLFDVETIENLNRLDSSNISISSSVSRTCNKIRKNLFTRTFSSTKFGRELKKTFSKKSDLNSANTSINSSFVYDGFDRMSCSSFLEPDPLPKLHCEVQVSSKRKKEPCGYPAHSVVLTSFHTTSFLSMKLNLFLLLKTNVISYV